jgi:hypothetical protein
MPWTPIRGSSKPGYSDLPELPGDRGRYLLLLGAPLIDDGPRWIHLSWRGESFAIRVFIKGRMMRQEAGLTASDVWQAALKKLRAIGQYYRPADDADWWTDALKKLPMK